MARFRILAFCLAVALLPALPGHPLRAEPLLPHLYDVTGVSSGDVLNVRAAPGTGADIIATLPADRRDVEVVEISPDGRWGHVGLGEFGGWASLAYLAPQPERPADRVPAPLRCYGTEPFWSLHFPGDGSAGFERMPEPERRFDIASETVPQGILGELAVTLAAPDAEGTLFLRREACSDQMSERPFGLSIRLRLELPDGPVAHVGCCSLSGR